MVEGWKRLAAAVIVQAALDYISPRKTRDGSRSAKAIKREALTFFRKAAERDGPERLWFDVLGIRPKAILDTLVGDMERMRRAAERGLPQRQVH